MVRFRVSCLRAGSWRGGVCIREVTVFSGRVPIEQLHMRETVLYMK